LSWMKLAMVVPARQANCAVNSARGEFYLPVFGTILILINKGPEVRHSCWAESILKIDLTTNQVEVETVDRNRAFIGGRGFGTAWLFENLDPETDPLAPENQIVISAGPLTGTLAPASARCSIETKSPKTFGICSSNVGGTLDRN